jgi:choline-sulfatase
VPARAGFATGKYPHQIGYWDNADPYDGAVTSWHHLLRDRGHRVASIGKLHFRGLPGDDHGFSEELLPMHVVDGVGDVKGLVRQDIPRRNGYDKLAKLAGPGESPYIRYDREIAARAQAWLREAVQHRTKPWALFVSFVCPHFPLIAPPEFYRLYPLESIPLPKQYASAERPDHPYLRDYDRCMAYDAGFAGDHDKVRRAIAGYLGLVSFMDDNVGKVLAALENAGLAADTRVVYTSDHGDNVGARGLWGKSTMYEESAGVPLILAGPDIGKAMRCATPASHVDLFPFFLECAGEAAPAAAGYHGVSPLALAAGAAQSRAVLSEYHAIGSTGGITMLRKERWKYVHCVRYQPQLFDLHEDPEELVDRAGDPACRSILAGLKAELRVFCDPAEVDARAKRRQAELLARYGGREAALARGDLNYTPAPGQAPDMN